MLCVTSRDLNHVLREHQHSCLRLRANSVNDVRILSIGQLYGHALSAAQRFRPSSPDDNGANTNQHRG